jgi:hypothetical protein
MAVVAAGAYGGGMSWPIAFFAAVLAGLVTFAVWGWVGIGSIAFPSDGASTVPGPITEATVSASVREVDRRDGPDGGCARVGTRPARFRCVLAGDRRYTVVVSRVSGCWHARAMGLQALHGCVVRAVAAAD